jgi:transaldolase
MSVNHLKELGALGQSLWLDYIRRDLFAGGELRRLIEQDGVRGMTSNPAIFEKAIVESQIYNEEIRALAAAGKGAESNLREAQPERRAKRRRRIPPALR